MMHEQVTFSNYSIGSGVYEDVVRICAPYGKRIALVVGDHGFPALEDRLVPVLSKAGFITEAPLHYGGVASYENVQRLEALSTVQNADMIFGIGGGHVLDTAKCLANRVNKPVFTFPTIGSNCAAATSVSIMYKPDGSVVGPDFLQEAPRHVFIDEEVLLAAPPIYLYAGIGDTYAKYYEVTLNCRDVHLNYPLALGEHISGACASAMQAHAVGAMQAVEAGRLNDDFRQTVLTIIITTAMVSILVTLDHSPDYNSGLAHAIYYALTGVAGFDHEAHPHGEVVGFGVTVALLVDRWRQAFTEVMTLNKTLGYPMVPEDLGLSMADMRRIYPAILEAADVRHYPYEITEDMLDDAFTALYTYEKEETTHDHF